MKLFRIRLATPASVAEDAAASLAELGCSGVHVAEGDPAVLEAHFQKDVAAEAGAVATAWGGKVSGAEWVEEPDWTEAWKKKAPPLVIGGWCVYPSHEKPREGMRNLKVDAGMAFGSGDHATTRLMMLEMEEMAKARPLGRVLDLGTGSGILAMAAIQLGATEVVAADIDRKALDEARKNVKENGIERVHFVEGSLAKCHGRFDSIIANVTTEVHLKRSGEYPKKLSAGGRLRIGGIRAEESDSVAQVTGTVLARAGENWTILKYPGEETHAAPPPMQNGVAKPAPGVRRSEDPPTLLPGQMKASDFADVAPAPPPRTVDRRRGAFDYFELNVSNLEESRNFYGRLLPRFGFERGESGDGWMSFTHGEFSVSLRQAEEPYRSSGFHRKNVGINHVAFAAPSKEAVDVLHEWLIWEGITVLYGGPMEEGTIEAPHYAVYFEDPDRLKLGYVYRP
ncbi:MAG: 50S ribosomal protein L11 methyltransferase [Planctomycetia bacterium]|nr:50S ribosomal protein L11 methyltransferase [Planctomycetia bacterium]